MFRPPGLGRLVGVPLEVPDHLIQAHARDELHCKKAVPVVVTVGVDRHDVCVVQSRCGLGFLAESVPVLRPRPVRQNFNRDRPFEGFLDGLVHNAHPAPSDLTHDAEVTELVRTRPAE